MHSLTFDPLAESIYRPEWFPNDNFSWLTPMMTTSLTLKVKKGFWMR
jgi:hypothetical protein